MEINKSLDFLSEVSASEVKTKRGKNVIRSLHLIPLKNALHIQKYAKEYNMTEDAISTALEESGYIVKLGTNYYPVSSEALSTLEQRAGVSGTALAKLKAEQYSRIINSCCKTNGKAKATVVIYDGLVVAFLSENYKVLQADQLFSEASKVLNELKGEFKVGYAEKTYFVAEYILPDNIVSAYKNVVPDGCHPYIRLRTSNNGTSGANIYPLFVNNSNVIPIGGPLCLEHKGAADIEKFKFNVSAIYSLYSKSLEKLKKLKEINISNATGCFVSIAKKLLISNKYVAYALADFQDNISSSCSAYDVYLGLCEILFYAQEDGKNERQLADINEKIARALNFNWSDYDIPLIKNV